MQTDESVKKLSPEIILTIAGIKILTKYFKQNKLEWKFVVAKAIQQVKAKCGADVNVLALCGKLIADALFK